MKGNGRHIHPEYSHILHKKSIGASLVELPDKLFGIGQLAVLEYGIYGNIDLCSVEMCKTGKLSDILHAVAGRLTRAETAGTYIYSIGAMFDGLDPALKVLGGRKQFYVPFTFHYIFYQMRTLFSGAIYISSLPVIPNASYHSSIWGNVPFTRSRESECSSLFVICSTISSRQFSAHVHA